MNFFKKIFQSKMNGVSNISLELYKEQTIPISLFKKVFQSKMNGISNISPELYKEHKIPVNGIEISVLETLRESKEAILLMPGFLGCKWTSFGPQIKELPTLLPKHKIVAWDPPGCGKSIPPERNFCLDLFRNDAHMAIELMKTLKCDNFSVLGWGDGAIAAFIMAGRFPEFIDKLVVWSSGAYVTDKELNNLKTNNGLDKLSVEYRNELKKMYGNERLNVMWTAWVNLLHTYKSNYKGDFCATEVDCIQAPTLILHGAEDALTDPVHVEFLRKHIKSSKSFELPEGGFEMHLTHAKEFNELVTKFLLEKPT